MTLTSTSPKAIITLILTTLLLTLAVSGVSEARPYQVGAGAVVSPVSPTVQVNAGFIQIKSSGKCHKARNSKKIKCSQYKGNKKRASKRTKR
jgi:hypothetical protein